ALTQDEAVDLLRGRADSLSALRWQEQARGWTAGVLLLAQSTPPHDAGSEPAAFVGQRIQSYLEERVIAPLSTTELQTVAAAALLQDVDVPALQRMGLGDRPGDILE